MMRDLRFLRRNTGKNHEIEEIENVPINLNEQNSSQELTQNPKICVEQEVNGKSKFERTPVKPKTPSLPLRTPERQGNGNGNGNLGRNRFGFSSMNEEGRSEMGSYLSQSSRQGCSLNLTPRVGGGVGRANSVQSESTSTQSTPTKSVSKPPNHGFAPMSTTRHHGSARVGNYGALSRRISVSGGQPCVVNTVEVPHFDLKEDPSFWMDHNVQVIIRVRPLNSFERNAHGYNRCVKQDSAQSINWIGQPETRFTFDHVACETVDQEMLFRMAGLPMVENCLSGYNSCMFAYGQTGSGKTYTMLGEMEDVEFMPDPHRGMTPRIFEFLFARIRAEEESRRDEKLKYSCKCSFLEIYNEQITDLLEPSSSNLLLREDVKSGVYVENLSEFEVHTVGDVLKLLIQGSASRKVAATNMNRESSRSHCVFTCVIESKWERDSTTNLRFARLNLVDLAGSERQKSSGAEGERLKEAANINKSLSTLGHVIMLLLDIAHGKPRHVPYRDSKLTFLLQDSLGGNSKTMIIANISPSICCAAETLNTLKFAQRAKLIQNNAVVNEDSSGDVVALQHQILLLKEELSALKSQNVSRTLAFDASSTMGGQEIIDREGKPQNDQANADDLLGSESKGNLRVSSKQLKSLETMLAGALRREQMAEASIRQLEAEIEQLNRLVRQREEDTRCTKMMVKFREDQIQRMESILSDLKPIDAYLLEENAALSQEIQILRAKVDKNPEVTRFALENIRLLGQLREFQDFYEEGEREMLMSEVSDLRAQFIRCFENNNQQNIHQNVAQNTTANIEENHRLHSELTSTTNELAECRRKLKSCLDGNAKLNREIEDLHTLLRNKESEIYNPQNVHGIKEVEDPCDGSQAFVAVQEEKYMVKQGNVSLAEEIMNLELEVDILKIILIEEKLACGKLEDTIASLTREVQLTEGRASLISMQCEEARSDMRQAQAVIEALESQQLLSINEIDDLKSLNSHYLKLLRKQELEISTLKERAHGVESENSCLKFSECKDSALQVQLKRMQASLDKAKRLNMSYQCEHASQQSNEEEMDEVRRQAEAETAEVIVCLQEELSMLQQQVRESELREKEEENKLLSFESKLTELQETLDMMSQDNEVLHQNVLEKNAELKSSTEDWELLSSEIEEVLLEGHEALRSASDHINCISGAFSNRKGWISHQFGKMVKLISEKESIITDLNQCLEDANSRTNELEHMLVSLRGAAMVMTESHQQECCEKEEEILVLRSELNRQTSAMAELENRMKLGCDQLRRTSNCATVAFLMVNRLSEINSCHLDALRIMDIQLRELQGSVQEKDVLISDQATALEEAQTQIVALGEGLEMSKGNCNWQLQLLDEQQQHVSIMQGKLEEKDEHVIAKSKEILNDLKMGVSGLRSSMDEWVEQAEDKEKHNCRSLSVVDGFCAEMASTTTSYQTGKEINMEDSCSAEDLEDGTSSAIPLYSCNNFESVKSYCVCGRNDATIILLRKELESAMESLKEVQTEMARLSAKNKETCLSERQGREGMETVKNEILNIQVAFSDFEKHCETKILSLDQKLQKVEAYAQETKELHDFELTGAKAAAAQKLVEVSCFLARFEGTQDTIKEADIMINGLMIANEDMKLEIENLRKLNVMLNGERDGLISEVQKLRSLNEMKETQCRNLEEQFELGVSDTMKHVEELERLVSLVQDTTLEVFMSLTQGFNCLKFEIQDAVQLMHSSLEEIWSEILVKDCALSVLHLCHMGVLLEAVTGLNAEISFLHHGLCESDAVISNLREHNMKSKKELEMCRMLKGKLLADIKNSFVHISSKEGETRELSMKLSGFKEKLVVLQHQEELMLERSNIMGSELSIFMKELDQTNSTIMASFSEQEKLLKGKEEVIISQAENFTMELLSKDLELLMMASELQQLSLHNAYLEGEKIICCSALDRFLKDIVTLRITADLGEQLLNERKAEVIGLQTELGEVKNEESKVCSQLEKLQAEYHTLKEYLSMKKEEDESVRNKLQELKNVNSTMLENWQAKDSECKSSMGCINELKLQNCRLQEHISSLESKVAVMEKDLEMKRAEVNDFICSKLSTAEVLCKKNQDLESYVNVVNDLQKENIILRDEIQFCKQRDFEAVRSSSSKVSNCVSSVETTDMKSHRVLKQLDESILMVLDHISEDASSNFDLLSKFLKELESVDSMAKGLVSQNLSLQEELSRKDEVLNGLLFDLRLLQESAVNSKDQRDEIEGLTANLESTEHELTVRSREYEEAVTYGNVLEAKLKEQGDRIASLEMELGKTSRSVQSLSDENMELRSRIKDITEAKAFVDGELSERKSIIDGLENEILEMGNTLGQMNELVESLKSNLDEANSEKDHLQKELVTLEEKVETAHALAEENEAIAAEAQEIAESQRVYAEEKEEEVKLLEKSVQELDSTISVLENKVDLLKDETERQRLQREELELELHSLKNQMHNVESADADIKRHLDEKAKNLQESLKCIRILEKDLVKKDTEIAQCKAHILELTVHAEAQACEYKQKFKELEAMVEQVKTEEASSHEKISTSNKLEKNASKGRGSASPFKSKGSGSPFKSRGSGSPFKCIGLGLAQQFRSEKDEELNAERFRIEELEALAASRQKEIFMLNARLAAAESMTHDVIRDLLGVKLDMSNYVTFLDKQQGQKIMEKAQPDSEESQNEEVKQLKMQLKEFIEERQGWLDEINRRQAEFVAAQVAVGKLRQENEDVKIESENHKKKVTELEAEVKKLSSQQNLHQRIHHHAKIKEENNVLKAQKEDLASRLRRTESYLSRIKEELVQYRARSGRGPCINFDEEQRLNNELKESENEKLRLAQALFGLCTSILKAAGVTKPTSEINLSAAEDALEHLNSRIISLERELEDVKFKNKISSERRRLAELLPDSSPFSTRSEENRETPRRASQAPFFSALDR